MASGSMINAFDGSCVITSGVASSLECPIADPSTYRNLSIVVCLLSISNELSFAIGAWNVGVL